MRSATRCATLLAQPIQMPQGQLIEELLRERRKSPFWAALEAETPDQAYVAEVEEMDDAFASETEAAIADYEAGA